MFDPTNEENNDEFQDAREHNDEEEEEEMDNTQLSDFDYLKGIMQSEYRNNEFSTGRKINEDGDYDLNITRDNADYDVYKRRVNYILLSGILPELERKDFVVPSYDILNASGLIQEIKPRFSIKTGKFLGFDYQKGNINTGLFKVIVPKGKGPGLRYTGDRTLQDTLMDFRGRLMDAQTLYEEHANGIIDQEMTWDNYFEGMQIDNNTIEGQVKGKREKDRIRAQIKMEYLT